MKLAACNRVPGVPSLLGASVGLNGPYGAVPPVMIVALSPREIWLLGARISACAAFSVPAISRLAVLLSLKLPAVK